MMNINYLVELLIGEHWPLLAGGMIIMLVIAYNNCFSSKASGRVYYRKGNSFFAFLSSIAGCFHFADLVHSWMGGKLVIIDETAVENPGSAYLLSFVIAILFGLAVGIFFYIACQAIMMRKAEFYERRYLLRHVRKLSRYQQDNYKYY